MINEIDIVRRINKTIVHDDGTIDNFERQLLFLNAGGFDVTMPLVVSPNSISVDYFDNSVSKPIIMRVSTAWKIHDKHAIGYAFVGQCLDMLRNSVLAFDSLTQSTSRVVVLDAFNEVGNPYIAICRRDKCISGVEVNEITSIYDKEGFEDFLIRTFQADKRFFKNKKTEQYIKSQRFQLPREMIYALSDVYYKPSFNKSQVENDILFAKNKILDGVLADAYCRSSSSNSSKEKYQEHNKVME